MREALAANKIQQRKIHIDQGGGQCDRIRHRSAALEFSVDGGCDGIDEPSEPLITPSTIHTLVAKIAEAQCAQPRRMRVPATSASPSCGRHPGRPNRPLRCLRVDS